LQRADVDFVERLGTPLVEAALRQPPMQRHLATFEAANRDARAGRLALAAAATRLAEARTDATADTHAKLAGAGIVFDAIEPHGPKLLFHLRLATPIREAGRYTLFSVADLHEMLNLFQHAPHGRSIFKRHLAAELVEAETDQRLSLPLGPPVRAPNLLHCDRFLGRHIVTSSSPMKRH